MNAKEKKSIRLKFPCKARRFIDVISLCNEGGKTRKDLVSILEKKGYFKLKTNEYIRYSTHWGLLKAMKTSSDKKSRKSLFVPTDLGIIFLRSWNKKKEKTAKEILYYGFVNSKKFPTLKHLVLELAKQLRMRRKFKINQTEIHNIICKADQTFEPRDSSSLTNALFVLGLLEKAKKGQFLVQPYFPSYEGFFLTLFHYYLVNISQVGKRISLKRLVSSNFMNYWLMNENILNKYINYGHNNRIIHREKYADVNQFYFFSENLMELTKNLVG